MLKCLSFELLESYFDNFCSVWSSIVMEQDHLVLLIGPFPLNRLIHSLQLGFIEVLFDSLVFLEHFPVDQTLPIPPYADHSLLQVKLWLDPGLGLLSRAHPLFPLLHIGIETPLLVSSNNSV